MYGSTITGLLSRAAGSVSDRFVGDASEPKKREESSEGDTKSNLTHPVQEFHNERNFRTGTVS